MFSRTLCQADVSQRRTERLIAAAGVLRLIRGRGRIGPCLDDLPVGVERYGDGDQHEGQRQKVRVHIAQDEAEGRELVDDFLMDPPKASYRGWSAKPATTRRNAVGWR